MPMTYFSKSSFFYASKFFHFKYEDVMIVGTLIEIIDN